MADVSWSTQEEYEALYGTQEEQAKKQVVATADADGPYRLIRVRIAALRQTRQTVREIVILPNSVRSTRKEIERLRDEEYSRTGVYWDIQPFQRGETA
jgi:chemotaxis protein histidine kinase CheA